MLICCGSIWPGGKDQAHLQYCWLINVQMYPNRWTPQNLSFWFHHLIDAVVSCWTIKVKTRYIRPMLCVSLWGSVSNCLHRYGVLMGGLLSERWLGVGEPGLHHRGPQLDHTSQQQYKDVIDAWGGWVLFQRLLKVDRSDVSLDASTSSHLNWPPDPGSDALRFRDSWCWEWVIPCHLSSSLRQYLHWTMFANDLNNDISAYLLINFELPLGSCG